MRNTLKNKANALFLLFAGGTAAFIACSGGDDAASPGSSSDGGTGADVNAASDASASADAVTAPTIDVTGTLLGRAIDNGPLASRDVVVLDANGTVTKASTDANGVFHVPGVVAPYDIAVLYVPADAASGSLPNYFAGISRSDPIVFGNDYTLPPTRHATISFTAGCSSCFVWIIGPTSSNRVVATGATQSVTYSWFGPATIEPYVYIIYQDMSSAYSSWHVRTPTLTDGATVPFGNLGTQPAFPSYYGRDVQATIPAGYGESSAEEQIRDHYGAELVQNVLDTTTTGGTGSLAGTMPNFGDWPVELSASASAAGPSGETTSGFLNDDPYDGGSVPVQFDLPAAALPLVPTQNATGVSLTSTMKWSASPVSVSGVYGISILGSNLELNVISGGTDFDLSRLAKVGIVLPSATTLRWGVSANTTSPTMDAYVGPGGLAVEAGVTTYLTISASQNFTTE